MCFLAAKVFMATFLAFKEDTKNRKNPYPLFLKLLPFVTISVLYYPKT